MAAVGLGMSTPLTRDAAKRACCHCGNDKSAMTGKGDPGDGAATGTLMLVPAGKALVGAVRWSKTIRSQALGRRNANCWRGRHHERTCS
eukprot:9461352-Ditylum_brightwellii.AAC.1